MLEMWGGLLPKDRIKAVQESLIGFINKEIILDSGEFFDTGEQLPSPDDYEPSPSRST